MLYIISLLCLYKDNSEIFFKEELLANCISFRHEKRHEKSFLDYTETLCNLFRNERGWYNNSKEISPVR